MSDPLTDLLDQLEGAYREIARLQRKLADYKEGAKVEADCGDEARAEAARLRKERDEARELKRRYQVRCGEEANARWKAEERVEALEKALRETALPVFDQMDAIAHNEPAHEIYVLAALSGVYEQMIERQLPELRALLAKDPTDA